jgi:predicted membrane protein DUF2157
MATPPVNVSTMVEHWVETGVVTAEQAARMRADLSGVAESLNDVRKAGRGSSLVTEAIGYLGGVIVLVASGLVTGWFWSDMTTLTKLSLAGGMTAVLLLAGATISPRLGAAPRDRLRSALWLLASLALAGFLGLLGNEWFGWQDDKLGCFIAVGTAAVSAALWYVHRKLFQHAATFIPVVIATGTGTWLLTHSDTWPAVAVWAVGAMWAASARTGVLGQREEGLIFGAAATVIATMTVVDRNWGTALALVTVSALVVIAVALRDLLLLAVGAVGVLLVLPPIMGRLFPGMLSAALALMAVGLLLVGVAMLTARRRHDKSDRPRPPAPPMTIASGH